MDLAEHVDTYPANVSEMYTNVVRRCLGLVDGRIRRPEEPGNAIEDQKLTNQYHDKVLRQLMKCRAYRWGGPLL